MDTNILEKKIDELTKLVNKQNRTITLMAKALHLVPVTEKEEKNLQILRRKNEELAYSVNAELDNMSNKDKEYAENALGNLFRETEDVYGDVIGSDILDEIYPKKED